MINNVRVDFVISASNSQATERPEGRRGGRGRTLHPNRGIYQCLKFCLAKRYVRVCLCENGTLAVSVYRETNSVELL